MMETTRKHGNGLSRLSVDVDVDVDVDLDMGPVKVGDTQAWRSRAMDYNPKDTETKGLDYSTLFKKLSILEQAQTKDLDNFDTTHRYSSSTRGPTRPQTSSPATTTVRSVPSNHHQHSTNPIPILLEPTPHVIHKHTTLTHPRRRFHRSVRARAPSPEDHLPQKKLRPDSGVLLSQSGRLCYTECKKSEEEEEDLEAGSMVANPDDSVQKEWLCGRMMGRAVIAGWSAGSEDRVAVPEKRLRNMKGVKI